MDRKAITKLRLRARCRRRRTCHSLNRRPRAKGCTSTRSPVSQEQGRYRAGRLFAQEQIGYSASRIYGLVPQIGLLPFPLLDLRQFGLRVKRQRRKPGLTLRQLALQRAGLMIQFAPGRIDNRAVGPRNLLGVIFVKCINGILDAVLAGAPAGWLCEACRSRCPALRPPRGGYGPGPDTVGLGPRPERS